MFIKIRKEVITGGLLALTLVIWSVFLMGLFNAYIETRPMGRELLEKFHLAELAFGAAIVIFIATFIGRLRRRLKDRESDAESRAKPRPLESTNKTELCMFVGIGIGGLLVFSLPFPVKNIAISNTFWLLIGLVPLFAALISSQKNLIEKKVLFVVSYIITFVVCVLIVSNFFNFFVNLLISAN